ncbi:MAG: sel1 repeat family protein [Deltaproteobacteria bacterium]|nr:sel1 repeat family protein [Deltaproteobacteria bacterium]
MSSTKPASELRGADAKNLAELYNRIGSDLLDYEARTGWDVRALKEKLSFLNDCMCHNQDTGDYETGMRNEQHFNEVYRVLQGVEAERVHADALLADAARFFRMSAELGDPEGMWNWGWRLWLGQGVPRERATGESWWARAAMLGHSAARERVRELRAGTAR